MLCFTASLLYSHFNILNIWSVEQCLELVRCRFRSEDVFGGEKGVTEEAAAESEGEEDMNTRVSPSLVCSAEPLLLYLYPSVSTDTLKLPPSGLWTEPIKAVSCQQAALVEGFACRLWGANVSCLGLCCCTDGTVWCWPGLGWLLWSRLLQCRGVPVLQVFTPSGAPLS